MMPELMNCPHLPDGWCLTCLQAMIPRATITEALAALRASLEETSDTFDSGLESWPYDDCRIRLEKVIAGLGLVVHEDQLPKILTDSQYNEWFKLSWIQDGVRVGFPVDALNLAHKEER